MEALKILEAGLKAGASDIHLSAGQPPLARVDGALVELVGFKPLSAEACKSLIYSLLTEEHRAVFEDRLELDCAVVVPGLSRFRVSVMVQRGAVDAVLRTVPASVPTPEAIGLGPIARSLADLPRGLVLVTGPTGCGKSTTLACLVDCINRTRRKHIITIEDPIEYVHVPRLSLVRQREVGPDTRSFNEALRHALRHDPDVIMVGEMRDLETISLTLTAAETGHLVLATLHTGDAAQTIDRIIDVFPSNQQAQVRTQLAGVLKAVIAQILLPRADGAGRVAARELMVVTPAIANLIRESKTHMVSNAIETGGASGMYTIGRAVAEFVRRGIVDEADAAAAVHDPARSAPPAAKVAVS
ncbi:type IV pilus twitching motility protein PilT [bacterium]|nr:MAG: type IV pilus twitching motility protein PilT [bacterium]